jgi:putative copper resistance protein D
MIRGLVYAVITLIDLVALSTLIGAAWCLLWIVRPAGPDAPSGLISDRLYRLFGVCLPAVAISSICILVQRSVEMSGAGLGAILPVMPAVVLKTHFGGMWLVRLAGVAAAFAALWTGRRYSGSRLNAALLFFAGVIIAFARSASGHAADFDDFSPQQLSDWMHLVAMSSWGGALMALALAAPPSIAEADASNQRMVAGIADRFYVLFGPVLSVLVLTGLYNSWVEVGSWQALVTTSYGRVLSLKLTLLLFLAFRYIAPPEHGRDEGVFAIKFLRRTRFEAMVVLGVLMCVAPLVQLIPARHQSHMQHPGHAGSHAGAHGPVVSSETNSARITYRCPEEMESHINGSEKVVAGSEKTIRFVNDKGGRHVQKYIRKIFSRLKHHDRSCSLPS